MLSRDLPFDAALMRLMHVIWSSVQAQRTQAMREKRCQQLWHKHARPRSDPQANGSRQIARTQQEALEGWC